MVLVVGYMPKNYVTDVFHPKQRVRAVTVSNE